MTDARFVYVTCENRDEALTIGRALVEERLAACANVIGGMTSVFWWEGSVQTGDETVLIAKTTDGKMSQLTDRVIALHGYDCPCVVALPIIGGHADFLDWVVAETETPS